MEVVGLLLIALLAAVLSALAGLLGLLSWIGLAPAFLALIAQRALLLLPWPLLAARLIILLSHMHLPYFRGAIQRTG